jgi:hypothetical protein
MRISENHCQCRQTRQGDGSGVNAFVTIAILSRFVGEESASAAKTADSSSDTAKLRKDNLNNYSYRATTKGIDGVRASELP